MGLLSKLFARKPTPSLPAAPSPASDPRALFRAHVEAVLGREPGVDRVAPHREHAGLVVEHGGQEHVLFLDNLFAETRELSPEERDAAIRHFLAAMLSGSEVDSEDWEEAAPRLLPVLRPASYGVSLEVPEPGRELLARPALDGLIEALVVDLPRSVAYTQRRHLEAWAVEGPRAFEVARRNLERLRDVGIELYEQRPSPLWHVASGDTHESSRLLLPGFLASFAGRVEGRPLAIVPERATLLIGGDARPETVRRLCEMAEREYTASSRSISPAVYTVDAAGRLVPYLRAGDDALAQRVRTGHAQLALAEYAAQKATLEKQLAKREVDLFVASFKVLERKSDGRPVSYCVWPEHVHGLLPRAELVAMTPQGEKLRFVPWSAVQQLAAASLEPVPGLWPPRFRIRAWPPPDVLAQLLARAVALEDYAGE
ncbi:DUF1444 domain-containing protein [Aggregicoccus sp. 17bor-14]|uniref:DUF1444 domain-containing protein n=1 Tax=Myxococcaceae TaxID=31 RepID=UPI00129C3581|nr:MULTISPECIES: DUF1444 domain-containing protein [Myxococcaceae]MBF5046424.1 DUF1444 domain-containing protein [Simulacricoccus sp. 17bor-14]MRI92143.1 DUF1444 domain-containing protein [Aggregicoccus sp. 17bor-14]